MRFSTQEGECQAVSWLPLVQVTQARLLVDLAKSNEEARALLI